MSKEQQELNLVKHNIGATKGKRSSFQTATNVDDFLDKEKTIDDKKPWNKLNKMQKIQKLSLYVNVKCHRQLVTVVHQHKIILSQLIKCSW